MSARYPAWPRRTGTLVVVQILVHRKNQRLALRLRQALNRLKHSRQRLAVRGDAFGGWRRSCALGSLDYGCQSAVVRDEIAVKVTRDRQARSCLTGKRKSAGHREHTVDTSRRSPCACLANNRVEKDKAYRDHQGV